MSRLHQITSFRLQQQIAFSSGSWVWDCNICSLKRKIFVLFEIPDSFNFQRFPQPYWSGQVHNSNIRQLSHRQTVLWYMPVTPCCMYRRELLSTLAVAVSDRTGSFTGGLVTCPASSSGCPRVCRETQMCWGSHCAGHCKEMRVHQSGCSHQRNITIVTPLLRCKITPAFSLASA